MLDAEVGIGELRVSDDSDFDDFDRDRFGFGPRDRPDLDLDERGNLACAGNGETASG